MIWLSWLYNNNYDYHITEPFILIFNTTSNLDILPSLFLLRTRPGWYNVLHAKSVCRHLLVGLFGVSLDQTKRWRCHYCNDAKMWQNLLLSSHQPGYMVKCPDRHFMAFQRGFTRRNTKDGIINNFFGKTEKFWGLFF